MFRRYQILGQVQFRHFKGWWRRYGVRDSDHFRFSAFILVFHWWQSWRSCQRWSQLMKRRFDMRSGSSSQGQPVWLIRFVDTAYQPLPNCRGHFRPYQWLTASYLAQDAMLCWFQSALRPHRCLHLPRENPILPFCPFSIKQTTDYTPLYPSSRRGSTGTTTDAFSP